MTDRFRRNAQQTPKKWSTIRLAFAAGYTRGSCYCFRFLLTVSDMLSWQSSFDGPTGETYAWDKTPKIMEDFPDAHRIYILRKGF